MGAENNKPTPEQFGYRQPSVWDQAKEDYLFKGGWTKEGGQEAYNKALEKWEEDNTLDIFIQNFEDFQEAYTDFLMWCMDNNENRSKDEWNKMKATEFRKRKLHEFFHK